jgi:pimeloyl-ACP methyl ester carboxylesterase
VTGAALLLHGNTMNFYTGAPRFLPPALTELGLACLAFNRSGHDILAIRDSRAAEGGAFQTAARELADVASAADWLAERGYATPVVIGHSNGGMLAAAHVADHPPARALVLLSAHVGGPEILALQCAAGQLAADRLPETLARAERLVREGRGRELLLVPGWWYVLSAESLLDRQRRTPDLLMAAPRIHCPVLFVRGDAESPLVYPAERFRDAAGGPCEVEIITDCDHFYRGREPAVTAVVAAWLSQTLEQGADDASLRT